MPNKPVSSAGKPGRKGSKRCSSTKRGSGEAGNHPPPPPTWHTWLGLAPSQTSSHMCLRRSLSSSLCTPHTYLDSPGGTTAPKLTPTLSYPARACVRVWVMFMDVSGDTWLIYHLGQPGGSTRIPAVLPVQFCLLTNPNDCM